ncbi:MAG: YHYH protein, partial [Pseudomonadota bacterium]
MHMRRLASLLNIVVLLGACGGGGGTGTSTSSSGVSATDTGTSTTTEAMDTVDTSEEDAEELVSLDSEASTEGVFCDYTDTTFNSQESLTYTSESKWSCTINTRELIANGIPDHDVGTFPNSNNPSAISEQSVTASFTLSPSETANATATGGPRGTTGYVLNGVKMDANTAGTCDDSGSACSVTGGTGGWHIEALGQSSFDFGEDDNNAHVQPGGSYHYHGIPEGFVEKRAGNSSTMTLIGWAADGFPIYARYGYSIANDAASPLKV